MKKVVLGEETYVSVKELVELLENKKEYEMFNKKDGDECFPEYTYMDGRIEMLSVLVEHLKGE